MNRKIPDDIKSDKADILKEAESLLKDPGRRRLLGNVLTLGGLSLATGVIIKDYGSVHDILKRISVFNDKAQGVIFGPNNMAPEYSEADITNPFPFNAFYPISKAPVVDPASYQLKLSGKIADRRPWTLPMLNALPQTSQITRHICVEGWSAIGKWGGVRFSDFLQRIGADITCKYVGFKCADGYYTSIDMPTALHAQTLLTLTFRDHTLPTWYGFPMKLRMPTKLGYKNPKHILEIFVTNVFPGGYWEDQGYNWFGGS
ncbi:molybdopterin-dependent oxidoreductase [Asticcacaulis sp. EMRT-3]|uniref:molybdopterin-dependent oxidoreductase n=1 Tax=Asticcacaulis sp. EMRT-3 TaxID=3040349 RepID=UPI0024AE88D6|nr:molybdopterin-dependent oxidoreductase [Asticcacaulis sp. EMRT-3]MDI7776201.1 molybdopterin-dependent oxidoreductase [Asticcacaulis sp. EMRT-3]